jgi:hypothetical protein
VWIQTVLPSALAQELRQQSQRAERVLDDFEAALELAADALR